MMTTLGGKTLLRLAGVRPAVDFVTPQLAIGGRARYWRLRRAGITHVINVRDTADQPLPGIICFHNPTDDDGQVKGHDYWAKSVEFAIGVLLLESEEPNPNSRLYVHCSAGINRSSGTVYAILRALGHSSDEAWALIKTARSKVRPRYVDDIEAGLGNGEDLR